ncbi:MAG: nucleoid-associated protein [gamma proteobacterium symbiont of Taylorina sp.]|nr:nucleoid-associated protein [gamma proteobacterium symbiont of Taylorina sp.]
MLIKEFIVHLLEKQVDSTHSNLSLSQETITSSAILENFLDELNKSYNSKATKVFGAFSDTSNTDKDDVSGDSADKVKSMDALLASYLDQSDSFLDYTHKAMNCLQQHIDQAVKASGGYMVFAHYTLFGSDFMMLAMLNNVSGVSVDNQLEISSIDYLDIKQLHLAARIDLTQWQEEPDSRRYISMVRSKESHKLSEYFKKFIGNDESSDSKQETSDLFTAIGQFCDKQFEEEQQKSEFKQKASDYCIEQAEKGQNVDIKDFSTHVTKGVAEGAIDDFMSYVNSEQFNLTDEVSPNKSVIRRFNKITGRNAQISITINEEALGDSVIYDIEKETLTISDLPAALKAQLLKR